MKSLFKKNIDSNFKLAIQYYQKALTACHEDDAVLKNIITSNYTECLAQYGHHLYRADDFAKALDFYSQAVELDPDHLVGINQIGMSLFKQNRFPEARKYFSDILDKTLDPQELADAWLNIACTHRLEKSWINAENALHKAKEFAPEDPSIFDEEQELIASKAQASLIAAPQTIFSNPNPLTQSQLSTSDEELERLPNAVPKNIEMILNNNRLKKTNQVHHNKTSFDVAITPKSTGSSALPAAGGGANASTSIKKGQ